MKLSNIASDEALLRELGSRLAQHRLGRNWSQAMLAEESGLSRPTIARLEAGHSTKLANLLRVLRALDLLDALELLVPKRPSSPMEQLRSQKPQRQRASRAAEPETAAWTWKPEQ